MGHLPGLDGIRALAVLVVIAYHLDLGPWRGGFVGVEVFFVVSGFLITSLMIEERAHTGRVDLRSFWIRRARRLLPALGVMLMAVTIWAVLAEESLVAGLRRDLLPALGYVSNWWQIFGTESTYFSSEDTPLLRHLWSLAVEEQWYLIWPVVFGLLAARTARRSRLAAGLAAASLSVMILTALASIGADADRVNALYLSTVTRSSGLVLGAAAALVWRPWTGRQDRVSPRVLAAGGTLASVVLVIGAMTLTVSGLALYRGGLAVVTMASVVLVAVAVHPRNGPVGAVLGWRPLVEVGRRSYGWYLWHWPIAIFLDARGDLGRSLAVVVATAVIGEASFRLVETPLRRGVLGAWWRRQSLGEDRSTTPFGIVAVTSAAAVFLVAAVTIAVVRTEEVDLSVDPRGDITFDPAAALAATGAALGASPPSVSTPAAAETSSDLEASSGTAASSATPVVEGDDPGLLGGVPPSSFAPNLPVEIPAEPIRLVVVGDSQADALYRNLPSGVEELFEVADGSLSGCGVYGQGVAISSRPGRFPFDKCAEWADHWGRVATRAGSEVALVIVGAWEVLDLELDGEMLTFATPEADLHFLRQMQQGIDALVAAGTRVALLEVACMRPVDVAGSGIPALPERGDDTRRARLNELLQVLAERNPETTSLLAGPPEWCNGSSIATDRGYRWDGVHVYQPGAKLILDAVAGGLVRLAAT